MQFGPVAQASAPATAFYRTIWRWHFYAGLLVMPMILILSLTGAAYLFKPQFERWEERHFHNLPVTGAVSPNAQLDAALAAFPGARFHTYRLPERPGDAAMIHLALADGKAMRDVFVSPQGRVVGDFDPNWRPMQIASEIHGQLLLGKKGSWIVELAACWAIVMILSGLYLWWSVKEAGGKRGLAGVVWPRLRFGKRTFWRDLHAVTGFWVAGLALVLLLTGLPWADVWGSCFKAVRTQLGWIQGKQDWTVGGAHAEHDHVAMLRQEAAGIPTASLADMVDKAGRAKLAFPVVILPPGEADVPGGTPQMVWTAKSVAQDRSLRATITYDMASGQQLSREDFADRHVIDRFMGYGIAWHEGQLLGWINQLIGVLTAVLLMILSVSGFVMWRRRKPADLLGAPPVPARAPPMRGVTMILFGLAMFLPLLAASLIVVWLAELLILRRFRRVSDWLGLGPARGGTA